MLDGYIIDAIKEAERNRHRRDSAGDRVRLELPLPRGPQGGPARDSSDRDRPADEDRGVIIIPHGPSVPLREENAA